MVSGMSITQYYSDLLSLLFNSIFSLVILPLLLCLLQVTNGTVLCVALLPKGRQSIQLLSVAPGVLTCTAACFALL